MVYPLIVRRRRPCSRFELVHQPGPMTMEALARAAGLMACADQRAEPAERAAFLSFLRRRGLPPDRRQVVLEEYDRSVRMMSSRPLPELCQASRRFRRFAGAASATLIADAAAHIAAADGVASPEELVLLRAIREYLALGAGPEPESPVHADAAYLPADSDSLSNPN